MAFIEVWAELRMQDQGVALICDADQYCHFKDLLNRRHMTICLKKKTMDFEGLVLQNKENG